MVGQLFLDTIEMMKSVLDVLNNSDDPDADDAEQVVLNAVQMLGLLFFRRLDEREGKPTVAPMNTNAPRMPMLGELTKEKGDAAHTR